jgi:peptidoglycan/xylan/chitin deacetylase (PgdA/CDA1 family)
MHESLQRLPNRIRSTGVVASVVPRAHAVPPARVPAPNPTGFGRDFSRTPTHGQGRQLPPARGNPAAFQHAAVAGTGGVGGPLPFLDRIQRAFGRHHLSHLRAYEGPVAARGAAELGAAAFTIGDRVAFANRPSLRTAAHEATHAVQQRAGARVPGGIGQAGDRYETHADAVADLVVRGRSAEALLDRLSPSRDAGALDVAGPSATIQLLELTYDDGPDANTRKTLEALQAGGATATFYLVGQKVQAGDNWKLVFDIAAAGHWLGNHAFDWNDAKDDHIFMSGTPSERAAKLLQTEFAIRTALIQGKADAQASKKWDQIPAANRTYIDDVIAKGTGRFRTPGFKSHWYSEGGLDQQAAIELASQIMEAAGLRRFAVSDSVSIDPKDWEKGKTQAQVEASVTGNLSSDSDSILLHSRLGISAAATPAVLGAIKQKGFTYQAPARGAATGPAGLGFSGVKTGADWAERFSKQVPLTGPAVTVNKTDPVDRRVTTQTGIAWVDYGANRYLAVISIENSNRAAGTRIDFITFVDDDLKDLAIARATPNQPRGIQTIAKQFVRFAPATPPTTAAKQ